MGKKQDAISMLKKMQKAVEEEDPLLVALQPQRNTNNREKTLKERKPLAFKTLVAAMLSARTKDEIVGPVVETLWKIYSTPEEIANAPLEELEQLVYSTGTFRRKAEYLKNIGKMIHEEYDDEVPQNFKDLLRLPGVGRKVANCVLTVSFLKDALPVETHIHRISNRTGWINTKTVIQTEKALKEIFPVALWYDLHAVLIMFGKTICKPRGPLCDTCPVEVSCVKRMDVPSL